MSQSAFVVVALTANAQIVPATLEEQFRTVGYRVVEQPRISRTRSDRAVVLNAYSSGLIRDHQAKGFSKDALTLSLLAAVVAAANTQSSKLTQQILSPMPGVTWPEFQPVWNVQTWCCTGLELYVVDDGDACQQLDVLAQGLACPRSQLTIKPRVGWQSYGHPDVQSLG
jgi:hypothetical protein